MATIATLLGSVFGFASFWYVLLFLGYNPLAAMAVYFLTGMTLSLCLIWLHASRSNTEMAAGGIHTGADVGGMREPL